MHGLSLHSTRDDNVGNRREGGGVRTLSLSLSSHTRDMHTGVAHVHSEDALPGRIGEHAQVVPVRSEQALVR